VIAFDGVRSKKLMWLAKKLFEQLRALGTIRKATVFDGFRVDALRLDEIEKANITAPTGLKVIASGDDGVYVWEFDHIFGGCSGAFRCHTLNDNLGLYVYKSTILRGGDGLKLSPITQKIIDPVDMTYWWMRDHLGNLIYTPTHNARPVLLPVGAQEMVCRGLSIMQRPYTDGSFTGLRPHSVELLFHPYGPDAPAAVPPLAYPVSSGRRSITTESDYSILHAWLLQLLPSQVVRGVRTTQGTFNFYNADFSSSTISPYRTVATVWDGYWGMWNSLTPEEQAGFDFADFTGRYVRTDITWTDLPADLVETLNHADNRNVAGTIFVLGNYAYALGKDDPVKVLTITKPNGAFEFFQITETLDCDPESPGFDPLCYFVDDNPTTREWKLFYTIYEDGPDPQFPATGATITTVTAEGCLGVLHHLYELQYGAYDPPTVNAVLEEVPAGWVYTDPVDLTSLDFKVSWARATLTFERLCSYPNVNNPDTAHYDSVMFHGPNGVYSWDRIYSEAVGGVPETFEEPTKYGVTGILVHFGATGLSLVDCYVPPEVGTIGVRPLVTYAGEGLYSCVCEKVGATLVADFDEVQALALYYGSPFTGWYKLPMPVAADGETVVLKHVRPVLLNSEKSTFLGIIRKETIVEGETIERYFPAILDFVNSREENAWITLAEIIFPDTVEKSQRLIWDLSPYGNGGLPRLLSNYLSPPPVVEQQYIVDNSYYENKAH
jgi:hypothetical protein